MVGRTWKAKMEPNEAVGQAQLRRRGPGAGIGGGEHGVDHAAGPGHGALAVVEAQDEEGEDNLQAESPGDGAPADTLAVG